MPQIDNNVDNICNSYNESSNNMYEKFFKKRLITVPVSHFITQSVFPQQQPPPRQCRVGLSLLIGG